MARRILKEPPRLGGALPLVGHMHRFARNPHAFMMQLRQQFGDVAEFKMFHHSMVLLTGRDASEAFYRAPDDVLDQGPAYKIMTPVFGKGVVFDAPIPRRNQQLQMLMTALRDRPMRAYADVIVAEVEGVLKTWGEAGETDLLEFMKQLTIYTATHCLLGAEFRRELSAEFSGIYHDLERGIRPIAYVFPNLPMPVFWKRNKARARLQSLVTDIMDRRASKPAGSANVFHALLDARYDDGTPLSPHEITGMLIAAVFAGHHTTSGTAAWVLIELLRHPEELWKVMTEIDELFGPDGRISFESLRQVPNLENVIKEVLRLHPPLIILMRKVVQDFQVGDYLIRAGKYACAAPSATHGIASLFPDPEAFVPDRYAPERAEDRDVFAWQAFGGGRHKCSGNAFALFQIKAIFCVLLRRYRFELVNPPDTYRDDYTKMVVQPGSPCPIRYRRRQWGKTAATPTRVRAARPEGVGQAFRVTVDRDLCKGHATCMAEAPEMFCVDDAGRLTVLQDSCDGALLDKARAAAKYCPTQAIHVAPDGPATCDRHRAPLKAIP